MRVHTAGSSCEDLGRKSCFFACGFAVFPSKCMSSPPPCVTGSPPRRAISSRNVRDVHSHSRLFDAAAHRLRSLRQADLAADGRHHGTRSFIAGKLTLRPLLSCGGMHHRTACMADETKEIRGKIASDRHSHDPPNVAPGAGCGLGKGAWPSSCRPGGYI